MAPARTTAECVIARRPGTGSRLGRVHGCRAAEGRAESAAARVVGWSGVAGAGQASGEEMGPQRQPLRVGSRKGGFVQQTGGEGAGHGYLYPARHGREQCYREGGASGDAASLSASPITQVGETAPGAVQAEGGLERLR